MSREVTEGSESLTVLDKLIWAFARSIGYSSFTEAIYLARFWAAIPPTISCLFLYRLLWKKYGFFGEPAIGGGGGITAILILAFYTLIHLAASPMEEIREAELSGAERWVYTTLAWSLSVGLGLGVPMIVVGAL